MTDTWLSDESRRALAKERMYEEWREQFAEEDEAEAAQALFEWSQAHRP